MKRLFLKILIMPLILIAHNAFAQSKAGTSSAQFLKIGVGARAIAMGDAFVAISDDALALYWNPAGLALLEKTSLSITHTEWFADLDHNYVGVAVPINRNTFGASVTFLNTDEIEITNLLEPEGTGLYYDASDMAISVSYARSLLDRFSIGVTGKYIQQKLYNESASALAIDVGTILFTGFKGLRVGMCLSNFGGTLKLDGPDLIVPYNRGGTIAITPDVEAKLSTEAWPLPTNFRVGIAMDILGEQNKSLLHSRTSRLTVAIDANHPTDSVERGNIGAEYAWNNRIAIRTGYKYNYDEQNLSFGGGINFNLGKAKVNIDYAWADFGRLDYVNRFSLGFVL